MVHSFAIWLIAGAILIAAEMVTGAYVAMSFASGCFAVSIIEVLTGGFSIARDVPLFCIVMCASFFALRRIFRHKGDSRTADADINRY